MRTICSVAAFLAAMNLAAFAQEPGVVAGTPGQVPPPHASRRVLVQGTSPSAGRTGEDLSRNYRVTLSLKAGDKPAKEIVVLTASAEVKVSAVLEQDEATQGSTTVEMNGVLAETPDRSLRFSYQIGASIPRVNQTLTSRSGTDAPKSIATTISYVNESATGLLILEPGKAYELFKSAMRSYTLTVEPEAPVKGK